jgi:hypothetical protein
MDCSEEEFQGRDKLPLSVLRKMEAFFNADFSDLTIYQNSEKPADMDALAFTEGKDIYFAPGEYRPDSFKGQELIAHELAHVIQQAEGRVRPTGGANGIPINDDPALEREADQMGHLAASFDLPLKKEPALSSLSGSGSVIQRQEKEPEYIPIKISFEADISLAELGILAEIQVIGEQVGLNWGGGKASYKKEESPVTVNFRKSTLIKYRIIDRGNLGAEVDESGEITGSGKRAEEFKKMAASTQKEELNKEIDKRYHAITGTDENEKIKDPKKEKNKVTAWNVMRDEVLAEREKLQELPDNIKKFLSPDGKEFRPEDYKQLLRIANDLSPEEWLEYFSRINAKTDNLDALETSVDNFKKARIKRAEDQAKLQQTKTKLYGLFELYKRYKEYLATNARTARGTLIVSPAGGGGYIPSSKEQWAEVEKLKNNLTASLVAAGFKGISDFEDYIRAFEEGFRNETVAIANDYLDQYEHLLYKEEQKYLNQTNVDALYNQLGGLRSEFKSVEIINQQIGEKFKRQDDLRFMGNQGSTEYQELEKEIKELYAAGDAHVAASKSEAAKVSITDPLLREDYLPVGKRLDKTKLAKADKNELKTLLLDHIKERREDIKKTRESLSKSMNIYGLDNLLDASLKQQRIDDNPLLVEIIKDKRKEEHDKHLAEAIIIAVVAIALGLLTFGGGTIAVAAAVASFGLSAYQAYESFREYETQNAQAGTGLLSEEPGIFWLVVAVAGAGIDLAMVGSSIKALKPLAETLEATGDVAKFNKSVQELVQAGKIEERVGLAATEATNARKGFTKASENLFSLLNRTYTFPGPFGDPDVYKALVKMAYYKAKEGIKEFSVFVDQIRLARTQAKLGEMTVDELNKLKQAFEEGQEAFKKSPKVFEEALDLAKVKKSVEEITERLKARIKAEPERFDLKLTDDQIGEAVKEGKLKGLDDKTIEDIIFQGSRKGEKSAGLEDIMEQMGKAAEIEGQGFPVIFKSMDEFNKFKTGVVKDTLKKLGLPVNDVRIQGSLARRTNIDKIGDIDIGIIVNKAEFDKWADHFVSLSKMPKKVKALEAAKDSGIIKASEMVFKDTEGGVMGRLYEQYKLIFGADAPKKMQLSIILEGGKFDLNPFIPL